MCDKNKQAVKGTTRNNGTPAWYLNNSRYPKRNGNQFTPYFSGKDIFAAIAHSIKNAKKSVDIICWGFDPAMPIVRPDGNWAQANTYGEILRAASARGVKVRLLLWYNTIGNGLQENAVGKMMKVSIAKVQRNSQTAIDYPEKWFKNVEANKYPNIEARFRDIKDQGLLKNEDKRSFFESGLLSFPTDHQKSVMVDYGYDGAHGYIMGHNSLTTYWDTVDMAHHNPLRELNKGPFHDFSMKIQGPCLIDLNHNFCESWDNNAPTKKPSNLLQERQSLDKNIKASGSSSGQIVRTRPDKPLNGKREQEIKRAYLHVAKQPRRFILVVNQYFQYSRWARELKSYLEKAKKAGYQKELYVFIFTPTPENKGMVFYAHQTANEFGLSEQFNTAEKEIYHQQDGRVQAGSKTTVPVKAGDRTSKGRNWGANPKQYQKDLAEMGINAVMCMLKTKVNKATPKEIYIHAKLTVIDDAFFTLGSANLNVRSMAVDSEINILSDDINTAYNWRKTLFNRYMGGAVTQHGKNQKADVFFEKFSKHILENAGKVKEKQAIIGHAVPFADERSAGSANVG